MPTLGPQQFEISISDQLYQTHNRNDPPEGIAPAAVVPVTIPWNLQRTELAKDKEVAFGKVRWSGAGTGPHDVFKEVIKLGDSREKSGTIAWSVETVCYESVETKGTQHRWLITPCVILFRTFTPVSGAAQTIEVSKFPKPCPGSWVATPAEVNAAIELSAAQPGASLSGAFVETFAAPLAAPKPRSRRRPA